LQVPSDAIAQLLSVTCCTCATTQVPLLRSRGAWRPGGSVGSIKTWFGSVHATNLLALVAILVSAAAVALSCQANRTADESLKRAIEQTPVGGILAPANLSTALCNRFSGFAARLPGAPTLWLALRATDSSTIYLTEVHAENSPSDAEKQAAERAFPGSDAWVAAIQVGDYRINQPELQFYVSLHYANLEQSAQLRTLNANPQDGLQSLPAAVEGQRLGDVKRFVLPQHVARQPTECSLGTAS